jgi:cyclohexadieny/prephenate dehydrogenase
VTSPRPPFNRLALIGIDLIGSRDIFLNNKDAVLEVLGRFNEDLATLTRAIRRGDRDTLFNLFAERHAIRRGMVQFNLDAPAPNFPRAESETREPPLPRPYAASGDD